MKLSHPNLLYMITVPVCLRTLMAADIADYELFHSHFNKSFNSNQPHIFN
jgi:hypothetical protein